ncbi:MAG: cytochrome c oxidase assembly factor 1 family protein [Desulfobacterales bacterium]|nr:cytochrome c oxidase assembly factor 1 family protein [Desulfobacterales bacterium]
MKQPRKENWWSRNWKWFVPVGCLGTIILVAGFVAVIMFIVFGFMKSSDVYKEAVANAKANTSVVEVLGLPIEEGLFVSGNINVSGTSGRADLSIPISGPNGKATVFVVATREAGNWNFSTLVVEFKKSGTQISLLE